MTKTKIQKMREADQDKIDAVFAKLAEVVNFADEIDASFEAILSAFVESTIALICNAYEDDAEVLIAIEQVAHAMRELIPVAREQLAEDDLGDGATIQ